MRAVIIDDDPKSIANLTLMLKKYCPRVDVAGTANSGIEGLAVIAAHKPELLFLDILMLGMSGFDMLAALNEYPFYVVFVSGHEEYGRRAIKFSALDYIMKPLDITEVVAAVKKAENKKKQDLNQAQIENLRMVADETRKAEHRIRINHSKGTDYIKISNIIMCNSDNNCTTLYLNEGVSDSSETRKQSTYLTTDGLYEYKKMLAGYHFIQPHMSWFVNLSYITGIARDHGTSHLLLKGTKVIVPIARNRIDIVKMELQNYHRR